MRTTLRTLLLSILMIITSFNALAKLICKEKSKTWFIYNENNQIIGDSEYAFGDEKRCQSFIPSNSNAKVICSWNGKRYQFYDVETGTQIGGTEHLDDFYHPTKDQLCKEHASLQPTQGEIICAWNGKNYSPFLRKMGTALSAYQNGYEIMDSCIKDSLLTAKKYSICSWNKGSTLYSLNGKILSPRFAKEQECFDFQNFLENHLLIETAHSLIENYDFSNVGKSTPSPFISNEPDESIGFSMKNCGVAKHRYHLTKNTHGFIDPECQPDTLYSWGGFEKLAWFINNLPNGGPWPTKFKRSLYTTQSPVATFGYGRVPLRFKIRPQTKMKLFISPSADNCDGFIHDKLVKKEDLDSTIIVRTELRSGGFSFQEYIICSPKVIESWSYLTEEHFDEILKDFRWATTKDYKEWEGYNKSNGVDKLIGNGVDSTNEYRTDFTQGAFNTRLNFIRLLTEAHLGAIHFPDNENSSIEQHFKTSHPNYFNPE